MALGWLTLGGAGRGGARCSRTALLPVVGARSVSVPARFGGRGVRRGARSRGSRRPVPGRARDGTGGRGVRVRSHAPAGDRRGSRDPALARRDPAGSPPAFDPAPRFGPRVAQPRALRSPSWGGTPIYSPPRAARPASSAP